MISDNKMNITKYISKLDTYNLHFHIINYCLNIYFFIKHCRES